MMSLETSLCHLFILSSSINKNIQHMKGIIIVISNTGLSISVSLWPIVLLIGLIIIYFKEQWMIAIIYEA